MARRFTILLLAAGAVGGFWSALHHRFPDRREAFERHIADLCTDAAFRTYEKAEALQKR